MRRSRSRLSSCHGSYLQIAARLLVCLLAVTSVRCSRRPLSPGPDPGCPTVSLAVSPITYLGEPGQPGWNHPTGLTPLVSGDRVLYSEAATLGSNSAADIDLFAFPVSGGTIEQLTADDADSFLLGADGGTVLYTAPRQAKDPAPLTLIRPDGPRELGHYFSRWEPTGDGYGAGPTQLVHRGEAVWLEDQRRFDGSGLRRWAIHHWDGARVRQIAEDESKQGVSGQPYLADGTVAWSAWDGEDFEIYLHRDGQTIQLSHNSSPDHHPVIDGGRVLWLCDESICLWEGGQTRDFGERDCSALDANGGLAAWVCESVVRLFDGERVRDLTELSGRRMVRSGLRLRGGLLAWLEVFEDLGRAIPDTERGQLMISNGKQTTPVATVGLPCIYCSAYWPPLAISLADGVLAWSYAIDPEGERLQPGRHAFTRIREERRCE